MSNCTVLDVADYFIMLALQAPGGAEPILHAQLQKLCYYAQALHLAFYGRELFPEEFEARQYGPVCPELYHEYKAFTHTWRFNYKIRGSGYTSVPADWLDEVYAVYGQFSSWRLGEIVREEEPWINAREQKDGMIISKEVMRKYYQEHNYVSDSA
jgi:uncharacterized phage-associated protein